MALTDSFTGIDDAATTTTKVLTVPRAVPVGYTLAISIGLNAGLTSVSSVSDGRSNTYAQRASGVNSANSCTDIMVLGKLTTALQAGDTLTFTLAATRLRFVAVVGVFDDVVSTALDGAAATATSNVAAVAVGPSGDPATDRALVLFSGACQSTATGITSDSPQVNVAYVREGTSSGERSAWLSYAYVTTPGTQSPTGTLSTAAIWSAAVTAYDATVAAAALPIIVMPPRRP